MLPPALRSARKPMPTTAATARPYRRLTAVPNTGLTVPANAKPNTTTTAETGTTFLIHTAVPNIGQTASLNAKPPKLLPAKAI